ncbi:MULTISPECIES: hypothetical protein [unclassified Solwaraspora]|uniref:hypothetical protein n=1 Tax=unclassified Solwaraspora TaxID=2627926 RepID=UPI00259B1AA0|nr:hypothetical protein [Solwaraspora sp. WMMA2056]WJK41890.1 hypothetical protein O7608_05660 [Solwaraspora sp. WMMA2056]
MEQRKHWWNGVWGRLARRDVFLRTDADHWYVEARVGGADGRSRFTEHGTEDAAYDMVRHLLAGPGDWREVSDGPPAARHRTAEEVCPPPARGTGQP